MGGRLSGFNFIHLSPLLRLFFFLLRLLNIFFKIK